MGTLQPPKLWGSGFDRPVAIMAGLTACAVLIRLPFLFNTGVDEAFYLVVGRQWLEGMPPYAHSFDVKPPLLFALMAAAEAAFGPSLLAAKALAMASVSATAYALFLFGGRFLSERAGVTAALLYILSSLSLGGAFSPAELILAPFAAFGMLLGSLVALGRRRPSIWPLLAAGFCLGAAASVKQTAIFEAAPLAAFLFVGRPPSDSLKAIVLLAAGFVIVPVGFAFYFLADGHFGAFFADAVVAAAGRVSAPPVSLSATANGLLIGLMLMLPIIILAAAGCVFPGGLKELDASIPGGLDSRSASRRPRDEGGACHLFSAASSAVVPHGGGVPRALWSSKPRTRALFHSTDCDRRRGGLFDVLHGSFAFRGA